MASPSQAVVVHAASRACMLTSWTTLCLAMWSGVILGFLLGQATAEECGTYWLGTWNPFYVFRQLSELQQSPWALLSEDMAVSLRESKRELMGMGLVGVLTGAAFYRGGVNGALEMYEYSTSRWMGGQRGFPDAQGMVPDQEPEWVDSKGPLRVPRRKTAPSAPGALRTLANEARVFEVQAPQGTGAQQLVLRAC